jgi:hypothetical protein
MQSIRFHPVRQQMSSLQLAQKKAARVLLMETQWHWDLVASGILGYHLK